MHRILNYLFTVLDWNSATLLFRNLSALLVSYLPTVWFGNVPVHNSPNSEVVVKSRGGMTCVFVSVFSQISSQSESQKNRFAFINFGKSSFYLPVFEISRSCRAASGDLKRREVRTGFCRKR
jgi:hypothetical protein